MSTDERQLELRGVRVREDAYGRICLDDLWALAGGAASQRPAVWRSGGAAGKLIAALIKKIKIPDHFAGSPSEAAIHAKRGRGSEGTFAHPIVAAAYAGYLDADLEVEIREVWLRYRSGDATLADEILQTASAEANHWAGVRALSRSRRNSYTDILKAHGVQGRGYMECTEAVYLNLLGGKSFELRRAMDLPPKTNLRDHLPADKLAFIMAAEALSAERIEEESRTGSASCAQASGMSASALRSAIQADRNNRQRKLV